MKYTLAITTHNRYELLLESFAEVINDDRISEVVIVDDCSEKKYWDSIKDLDKFNPKIRVIRQAENRGMSQNKADAIAYAKNEWVIIFDSDNIIKPDYLDAIPPVLDNYRIYLPDFAWPNFDYRKFANMVIDFKTAPRFVKDDLGNCCMNTCNYLVNRNEYELIYKFNPNILAADTIWFALQWLKSGRDFQVVPGMTYFHRVHEDSGFLKDVHKNMDHANKIRKTIMQL